VSLTWEQALTWRMRRHHLIERAAPSALARVVARLRGLHAQVMSSVDLALWARIEGLRQDDVADALWRRRTLLKTWAMRSTLHVLPAAELGTNNRGIGDWKPGGWTLRDPAGLPLAQYVDRALRGQQLTRAELAGAVTALGATPKLVKSMLGGWGGCLNQAAFLGWLCFAPNDGAQARFTHPATWLRKRPAAVDTDEACDALTLGYLGTHGPAAASDLAWRWGINQGEAKRRLAAVREATAEVSIDGRPYWMLAKDVAELAATEPVPVVRLLPAFDQWVMCASRQQPAPLEARHRHRIYRQQGWVSPVLLVDGRMVGVWKHERQGQTLAVTVEPFGALPRGTRAPLTAEAERLAAFLGGKLALRLSKN
jgi:uncharacterized protein YcaQ